MFDKVFDADNPLMRALSVAADLLILNILTVLCSIPIVTAGAAYTALNDMVLHCIRGEEGYLFKGYFSSFRANMKKGSALGLIFSILGLMLFVDIRVVEQYLPAARILFYAIGILILAAAIYAFALLARYENTLLGTLKNSLRLVVGFFPYTIGMVAFVIGFWLLVLNFLNHLLPVAVLFGVSLPCYLDALLYDHVFRRLDEKTEV